MLRPSRTGRLAVSLIKASLFNPSSPPQRIWGLAPRFPKPFARDPAVHRIAGRFGRGILDADVNLRAQQAGWTRAVLQAPRPQGTSAQAPRFG